MKNTKLLFLISLLSLTISNLFAQENNLFIHREIQKAIEKETRTITGKPGPKYWQNKADYTIKASFDPATGKITGKEVIRYKNNSPKALYSLSINLYQNLFQKGVTRDRLVAARDVHNGVELKKIEVNGKPVRIPSERSTVQSVSLPERLYTGQEAKIYIEWELKMPLKTQIRVGHYGKNTWFVGYWYPHVAVFDDIYGWDDIPYDGLHEFYMPFSNYDVKITAPADQVVWATGIWQNPEELLQEKFLNRYQKALKSKKTINIIEAKDLGEKITKSDSTNTWHFKARNVTDFVFATADNYLWDGLSVEVDKKTKREAFIQATYNKNSKDFYEVAEISKRTIQYLSDSMPGIPYPYPRMTVFNGGGGMEFPMMVNDRSSWNKSACVNLTSHEIAHTYFPFYMGINQERFSWMDEGMAQFLPAEFQEQEVSGNKQAAYSARVYAQYAGNGFELPMMVPSFFQKGYEYYIDSYYRPELAFRTLQNLLGEELFLKALQEFMHRWNGKHPSPYDFFFTFNDVVGEDLSWFWKPWFFEMAYPDLAIKDVKKNNGSYEIIIENKGGLPLPIYLTIRYNDNSSETLKGAVALWKDGKKQVSIVHKTPKSIKAISLGNERVPDTNSKDNRKSL